MTDVEIPTERCQKGRYRNYTEHVTLTGTRQDGTKAKGEGLKERGEPAR